MKLEYISQKIWLTPKCKKIIKGWARKDKTTQSAVVRTAIEYYHLNEKVF